MASEISLREVFDHVDADGSGKIEAAELKAALIDLCFYFDDATIDRMVEDHSAEGSGTLDYKGFAHLIDNIADYADENSFDEVQLRESFALVDRDDNGAIDAAELHIALNSLDLGFTMEECKKLVAAVDSTGRGVIEFKDFARMSQLLVASAQSTAKAVNMQQQVRMKRAADARARLMSDLRRTFDQFDGSMLGRLGRSDLAAALHTLNIDLQTSTIDDLWIEADKDSNGWISFREFCEIVRHCRKPSRPCAAALRRALGAERRRYLAELQDVFEVFDASGCGAMNFEGFVQQCSVFRCGDGADAASLKRGFDEIDLDANGVIDFREFAALFLRSCDGAVTMAAVEGEGWVRRSDVAGRYTLAAHLARRAMQSERSIVAETALRTRRERDYRRQLDGIQSRIDDCESAMAGDSVPLRERLQQMEVRAHLRENERTVIEEREVWRTELSPLRSLSEDERAMLSLMQISVSRRKGRSGAGRSWAGRRATLSQGEPTPMMGDLAGGARSSMQQTSPDGAQSGYMSASGSGLQEESLSASDFAAIEKDYVERAEYLRAHVATLSDQLASVVDVDGGDRQRGKRSSRKPRHAVERELASTQHELSELEASFAAVKAEFEAAAAARTREDEKVAVGLSALKFFRHAVRAKERLDADARQRRKRQAREASVERRRDGALLRAALAKQQRIEEVAAEKMKRSEALVARQRAVRADLADIDVVLEAGGMDAATTARLTADKHDCLRQMHAIEKETESVRSLTAPPLSADEQRVLAGYTALRAGKHSKESHLAATEAAEVRKADMNAFVMELMARKMARTAGDKARVDRLRREVFDALFQRMSTSCVYRQAVKEMERLSVLRSRVGFDAAKGVSGHVSRFAMFVASAAVSGIGQKVEAEQKASAETVSFTMELSAVRAVHRRQATLAAIYRRRLLLDVKRLHARSASHADELQRLQRENVWLAAALRYAPPVRTAEALDAADAAATLKSLFSATAAVPAGLTDSLAQALLRDRSLFVPPPPDAAHSSPLDAPPTVGLTLPQLSPTGRTVGSPSYDPQQDSIRGPSDRRLSIAVHDLMLRRASLLASPNSNFGGLSLPSDGKSVESPSRRPSTMVAPGGEGWAAGTPFSPPTRGSNAAALGFGGDQRLPSVHESGAYGVLTPSSTRGAAGQRSQPRRTARDQRSKIVVPSGYPGAHVTRHQSGPAIRAGMAKDTRFSQLHGRTLVGASEYVLEQRMLTRQVQAARKRESASLAVLEGRKDAAQQRVRAQVVLLCEVARSNQALRARLVAVGEGGVENSVPAMNIAGQL